MKMFFVLLTIFLHFNFYKSGFRNGFRYQKSRIRKAIRLESEFSNLLLQIKSELKLRKQNETGESFSMSLSLLLWAFYFCWFSSLELIEYFLCLHMTFLYHWTKDTHYNKASDNASKVVQNSSIFILYGRRPSIRQKSSFGLIFVSDVN
jgi:hypothetical protein